MWTDERKQKKEALLGQAPGLLQKAVDKLKAEGIEVEASRPMGSLSGIRILEYPVISIKLDFQYSRPSSFEVSLKKRIRRRHRTIARCLIGLLK
jgi:hypothetical protein